MRDGAHLHNFRVQSQPLDSARVVEESVAKFVDERKATQSGSGPSGSSGRGRGRGRARARARGVSGPEGSRGRGQGHGITAFEPTHSALR